MDHQTFRSRELVVVLFFLVGGGVPSRGESLSIEPEVIESKYCLEPEDVVSFRVLLRLKYHNTGHACVIVPKVTRLSAQMLFRDEEDFNANHVATREVFGKLRMYDTSKLDRSVPDPRLFDTIQPGATFDQRQRQVFIVVRPSFPRDVKLLGTEPYLQVEIDHWPDRRAPGEKLRESWKSHGQLLIDKVLSLPVRLRIEKEPPARPCREPPEIRIKPGASTRQGR